MDADKFEKYKKERYEPQVKWYDKKSISNKKWNNILQILVIVIAAILPVSAVLEYKWPTVILAAIVAIGTGILKYCKFEEHWHNYRTTCETLKKEKYYYEAKIGEYKESTEPEDLFVERVEALISQAHTKWDTTVKKAKKTGG
jgi:hypothetical protein